MEMINLNVLGWSLNPELQHHRRAYVNGRKYHLPIPKGYIYPFQITRPRSSFGISRIEIIREETGEVTNILAAMTATGLSIIPGDQRDTIKYLGTIALPGVWAEGLYYLRMSDAQSTWVSDYFCMTANVESLVKLEWWHDTQIMYRDGCIDYQYPYRNYVYLGTDIGKPGYFTDRQVVVKNGLEETVRVTTWKQYNFEHLIPEYLADCLRTVTQHHHVLVHHLGRTFVCESFSILNLSWEQYGALAITEFAFRTGTLITTRQAPQVGSGGSNANPSQCVTVKYVVNTVITQAEFRQNFGNYAQYGITGEHFAVVLVLTDAGEAVTLISVYQITHLQTTPNQTRIRLDAAAGDLFFDLETETYYVNTGGGDNKFTVPGITSIVRDSDPATTATITGNAITGAQADLYFKTEFGPYILAGSFTSAEITAGVNIDISGWFAAKLKFVTATCGELQESEPLFIDLPEVVALTGLDYNTVLDYYILQ